MIFNDADHAGEKVAVGPLQLIAGFQKSDGTWSVYPYMPDDDYNQFETDNWDEGPKY